MSFLFGQNCRMIIRILKIKIERFSENCSISAVLCEWNDKEVYDTTGLISGTSVQVLEVGKWTKFEGTYKIPSGAKKVVIRILEQGDWQEPGSCIMGKYYVANVSMKRSQNQNRRSKRTFRIGKHPLQKVLEMVRSQVLPSCQVRFQMIR